MKKTRFEEWKEIPDNVDQQWLTTHMVDLRKKLFGSINITKALYGAHAIRVLTGPVFELRLKENDNLFLICMVQIETTDEVLDAS